MNNSILKRVYYALEVELISPVNVSSGENIYSDSDIIVNGDGIPFIPGSSVAGAFRNALGDSKSKVSIMGYSDGEEGSMSGVYISDIYFNDTVGKTDVVIRDGVSLNRDKSVNNKFDMEILGREHKGVLFISYLIRQNDNADDFKAIDRLITGLCNGDIRIGGNKNRGFGRFKVTSVYTREFDRNNANEYIGFAKSFKDLKAYGVSVPYEKWAETVQASESGFIKLKVPLRLTGGISIRKYSATPNEADYEHITDAGQPVIPGTSWNGAIRSDAVRILKELGVSEERSDRLINSWFGYVDAKTKSAHQSNIIFGESVIDNSVKKHMSRNKINRFNAATIDGALYSEITYFSGDTTLEIMIRKASDYSYEALVGMMKLVIDDIRDGFVSIGGQAAIGRGVLAAGGEVISDIELDDSRYIRALYEELA